MHFYHQQTSVHFRKWCSQKLCILNVPDWDGREKKPGFRSAAFTRKQNDNILFQNELWNHFSSFIYVDVVFFALFASSKKKQKNKRIVRERIHDCHVCNAKRDKGRKTKTTIDFN